MKFISFIKNLFGFNEKDEAKKIETKHEVLEKVEVVTPKIEEPKKEEVTVKVEPIQEKVETKTVDTPVATQPKNVETPVKKVTAKDIKAKVKTDKKPLDKNQNAKSKKPVIKHSENKNSAPIKKSTNNQKKTTNTKKS